jgi:disulfide oxidoreductase YuzD
MDIYFCHKKRCNGKIVSNNYIDINKQTDEHSTAVQTMIELIKQNQEFKQLLIEQNQTIIELSKKNVDVQERVLAHP